MTQSVNEDEGLTEQEAVAAAVELAEDYVPTIDAVEASAPPPVTYRDWLPQDTRVVVYTTDPARFPKDRPAVNRAQAKAQCELVFGRVLESNYVGDRCFFRVRKVVKSV